MFLSTFKIFINIFIRRMNATFFAMQYALRKSRRRDSMLLLFTCSPSQARITSPNQMCQYLLMDGTCKCGLECPLLLDRVFHFDPSRPSKPWSPADIKYADDVTKLCSHKRKIIAMATFQNTTSMQKLHRQNETQPAAQITPQKRLGRKRTFLNKRR